MDPLPLFQVVMPRENNTGESWAGAQPKDSVENAMELKKSP